MMQYRNLICDILHYGEDCTDRTGTGTKSIFGYQMKFYLSEGFPLVTLKRTWFKGVAHELLWFISGSTNTKYLVDNKVHIWDEWADKNGNLGPVYGKQWREWKGSGKLKIDQLKKAIEDIKTNPDSRRIIVNSWNVSDIPSMALPPCHMFFQFRVMNGVLHCHIYQRSADVFLGVPFNIASYALLTHMVAQVTDLKPGTLTHSIGDAHLYNNHIDKAREMLKRSHKPLPTLYLNPNIDNIDDFTIHDITLEGYEPNETIKADVSV